MGGKGVMMGERGDEDGGKGVMWGKGGDVGGRG